MLRSIIICPDRELAEQLEQTLTELGQVNVLRTLDRYPGKEELMRFVRAHAPQVIFLSIDTMQKAMEIVSDIETNANGIQMVALHRTCDPQTLLEVMRVGIREFVSLPFNRNAILEALGRLSEILAKKPPTLDSTDQLFAFLPSKAGVGTTTVAVNVAMAMAKLPETNVLLADLDLSSGMIRFMLKLDNAYSITDAAEHALNLDENLWPQLVSHIGQLDVLHAGKVNPAFRLEAPHVRHMVDFVRRNYKAICIDLSGNMEKYSLDIMHESKRVFLVCTPEIPSLHLAREKYQYLKSLDLGDRVSVLVNRWSKRPVISSEQIEQLLGLPVAMTLPNDYQGVHKALTEGRQVDPTSELGRQFLGLAQSLLDKRLPTQESKKRFVEFFNLVPARYGVLSEGKKTAS